MNNERFCFRLGELCHYFNFTVFSSSNIKLQLAIIAFNTGVNVVFIFLISLTIFSLQEPHPSGIRPESGPQAGGTTLTITGTNLATGSKKDVRVSVGSQPCNVYVP